MLICIHAIIFKIKLLHVCRGSLEVKISKLLIIVLLLSFIGEFLGSKKQVVVDQVLGTPVVNYLIVKTTIQKLPGAEGSVPPPIITRVVEGKLAARGKGFDSVGIPLKVPEAKPKKSIDADTVAATMGKMVGQCLPTEEQMKSIMGAMGGGAGGLAKYGKAGSAGAAGQSETAQLGDVDPVQPQQVQQEQQMMMDQFGL